VKDVKLGCYIALFVFSLLLVIPWVLRFFHWYYTMVFPEAPR
jgi:hypothetical protein